MEIKRITGELIFRDNSQLIKEAVINAILKGANLRGANLSDANLSEAKGIIYAQVSFNWHGERGRQLSAVKIDGDIVLFCGCFKGSVDDLIEYIEGGDEKYKHSRTVALNTVMSLIKI